MTARPVGQPPPVPPQALRPRRSSRAPGEPPPVPPEARLRPAPRSSAAPLRQPPPVPPEARHRVRVPSRLRSPTPMAAGEPALVEAARAGSARAFTALVRLYRPRILALVLHMTGDRTDAEDITQEVFLRAYQHLPAFEGRSAFFTWIYRIALNRALAVRQQRRAHGLMVGMDDPRVSAAVAVDARHQPQRALELRETYAHLLYAFDQLSPLLRTTVALVTLQGLSYPEVAQVMGTTEGTVAWRMHESRDQLRRSLATASVTPVPELVTRPPDARHHEAADGYARSLALALAAVVYV